MCIVIVKKATAQHPTDDVLKRCWQSNPHGAGLAYATKDGVAINKGHMTLDSLIGAMDTVRKVDHSWYLVHFRIATHGSRGGENTHPFWTAKNKVAIAHNGILPCSSLADSNQGRSDTNAFAEDFLSKLPEGWMSNPFLRHVIEEYMGSGNKIAVVDSKDVYVLNERGWNLDKETGLVYSNYSWKPVVAYTPSNTYEYGGGYRKPMGASQDFPGVGKTNTSAATTPVTAGTDSSRKSYHYVCTLMASLRRRGAMSDTDCESYKALMKDNIVTVGEVQLVMDHLKEAVTDDATVNLGEMMTVMGAHTLANLCVKTRQFVQASQEQDETKVIALQAPDEPETLDFSDVGITKPMEEEPFYDNENSKCFVGLNCRVKTKLAKGDAIMTRYVKVTEVDKEWLHYSGLLGSTSGKMAWCVIQSVEALMALARPTLDEIRPQIGAKVHITVYEGNPVVGTLISAEDSMVGVKHVSGAINLLRMSNVLSVIIYEKAPAKAQEATK